MKIRTDFVTNSSSSSWIYLSSVLPAAAAVVGFASNAVYAGIAGSANPAGSYPQSPPLGGSRILDGVNATRWLRDNQMLDGGKLNDNFWNNFYNEGDPDCLLQAIAGDWRTEDRDFPIGRITIVIKDTGEIKGPDIPVREERRDVSLDLLGQRDTAPGGAVVPEVEPQVEPEVVEPEAEPEVELQDGRSSGEVIVETPVSGDREEAKPPQGTPTPLEGLLGVRPDEVPELPELQTLDEPQKGPLDLAAWEEKINQNIAERLANNSASRENLVNTQRTFQLHVIDQTGQKDTTYLELREGKVHVSRETTASEFAVSVNIQKELLDKLLTNLEKTESAVKDADKDAAKEAKPIDPMDLLKGMENLKYDKEAVVQLLDIFEADKYKSAFELYDLAKRGRDLLGF